MTDAAEREWEEACLAHVVELEAAARGEPRGEAYDDAVSALLLDDECIVLDDEADETEAPRTEHLSSSAGRKQSDIRGWLGLPPPKQTASGPAKPPQQTSLLGWLGGLAPSHAVPVPAAPSPVAPAPLRKPPFYKRVAPLLLVDAFSFIPEPLSAYILTHFHSDHYGGLTQSWSGGPIWCTETTARLVRRALRVPPALLRPMPLGVEFCPTEGVLATFHDANHCPGAAVVLLRTNLADADALLTLHTGDFRASPAFLRRPEIAGLAGRVGQLYLDTTYADAQYDFPEQTSVLASAAEQAAAACARNPRLLVVIGAYAIGKERVALAVATALNTRICVDSRRKAMYDCFDFPELAARLTTRAEETNVHIVPIGWLNRARLKTYLDTLRGYNAILAFKPTGWTHTQQGKGGDAAAAANHFPPGTVRVVGVPYSEHSSAGELRACLRLLRPKLVQPTVNVATAEQREAMRRLMQSWMAG